MKETTDGRTRRAAAWVLGGLGILGLGVAAASQLNMDWDGNFQAGNVIVDADCQDGTIDVSFDDPKFDAVDAELPWTIANVNFAGVDNECVGLDYEAAYKTGGEWEQLDSGTVTAPSFTVALDGVDPQTIDEVALTIYSE